MTEGSGRRRLLVLAAAGAFAAATVALFAVSRGKWSDALVDSGNVWIIPFSIARGELLYRDAVYWFGPFTPYFHATFFKVFGSSFATLVLAGVVGSVATLAALRYALGRVVSRAEAWVWTALAVPALVFMPNSGGSILGMGYRMWHAATFALLSVAVLAAPYGSRRGQRVLLAGAFAGLAGLCRTEWGLVTLLAAGLVLLHGGEERREAAKGALRLLGGFVLFFGGAFLFFGLAAGWRALLRDAPVLLWNVPAVTRENVALAGASAWRAGAWTLLFSSATWLALYLLTEIVALRRADPGRARRRLPWLLLLLAILAAAAGSGGLSGGLVWSAAPLVCAVACVAALRAGRAPSSSALLGFGVLGLLLSHRRLFFIADGAYVGPPLLFAFACAAGLVSIAIARERDPVARERLRAGVAFLLVFGTIGAFAARFVEYARDDRVAIEGTAGLLRARPELAREIEELSAAIRTGAAEDGSLVVFPEGELFNYLSGRRNPIRHKLYLPGYLSASNEGEVLAELDAAAPDAVVVWRRPLGEYGAGSFGDDYGREIRRWIERNYELQARRGGAPPSSSPFELHLRRASGR